MKQETFQGLRGYAALIVFISHCAVFRNSHGKNGFAWLGGLGVSIFILMSGYLAVRRYQNGILPEPKGLLMKRIKKFYPLHILMLIVSIPFVVRTVSGVERWETGVAFIANVFMVQSWIPAESIYFSFNAVSWYLSLAVFFALVNAYMVIFWRRKKDTVIKVLVWVVVFQFAWCFLIGEAKQAHWLVYICPIIRGLDFLVGGGVWVLKEKNLLSAKSSNRNEMIMFIAVFFMVIVAGLSVDAKSEFFSVALWTIPAGLMVFAVDDDTSKLIKLIFGNKVIVFLGNISFEFFMIHQLAIKYTGVIFRRMGLNQPLLLFIVSLILALISSAIYSICEKKLRNM